MGTVVLSPQDCLSSPHKICQNYYFSSARRPKPDKSVLQEFMVPLSAAEDCTRQDSSGRSPPQDGILPIPHLHGQARAFSKRSFSSKAPFMCSAPLTRNTTAGSTSSMVKPKLSRSASAILPTPLTGSPPNLEGDGISLLKGRIPLKAVQGNGLGSLKVDVAHSNSAKKHVDTRHGSHKKTGATNLRTANTKAVHGPQDRKQSKPVHDGADYKEKSKVDIRNQNTLEQSLAGKGSHERHDLHIQTPSVTILQRPNNEEAAAQLFAKYFQNIEEHDVVTVNEQVDFTSEKVHVHEMNVVREILQRNSMEEPSSDSDCPDDGRSQTTSLCSTDDMLSLDDKKFVGGSSVADTLKHAVSPSLASPIVETYFESKRSSKNFMLESTTEELAPWERWAGPSYINSPPPSALPLPRFPGIPMSNRALATIDLVDAVSGQALLSSPHLPVFCASRCGECHLCLNSDTVVSATKDLRRILNLDFYRV